VEPKTTRRHCSNQLIAHSPSPTPALVILGTLILAVFLFAEMKKGQKVKV
jgi:hypothetical protein